MGKTDVVEKVVVVVQAAAAGETAERRTWLALHNMEGQERSEKYWPSISN
jgi:hypothetical protein